MLYYLSYLTIETPIFLLDRQSDFAAQITDYVASRKSLQRLSVVGGTVCCGEVCVI